MTKDRLAALHAVSAGENPAAGRQKSRPKVFNGNSESINREESLNCKFLVHTEWVGVGENARGNLDRAFDSVVLIESPEML